MTTSGGPKCRDRGAAGLWSLVAVFVVLAATTAALAVGSALLARQRAQNAADLAAIAAATALVRGDDACGVGARTARAGGARLVACSTDPAARAVAVVVTVRLPRGWATLVGMAPARAAARAGAPP